MKQLIAALFVALIAALAVPAISQAAPYLHVSTAGAHTCALTKNEAAYHFWVTRGASWTGCYVVSHQRYNANSVSVVIRHTSNSPRVCQRGDNVWNTDYGIYNSRWYPGAGGGSLDCFW